MTDDDTIHIDPNGNPVPDPKPPPDRWYDYVIFGLGPTSSPVIGIIVAILWVGLRFVCRVTFTAVFIFAAWLLLASLFPIFQVQQIIVAVNVVLDFASLYPNGTSLVILLLLFFILPIGLVLTVYDRVQACRRDGAIGLIPSSIRMLGPLIAMVGAFFLQMGIFSMRALVVICMGLFAVAAFILLFPWSLILLVLFGVISAAVKHGVAEGIKVPDLLTLERGGVLPGRPDRPRPASNAYR
jgi:hypothetical protein